MEQFSTNDEDKYNRALLGGSKVVKGNPEKDQFSLIQPWII